MIKNEIIPKEDYPITIKHKKGEVIQMLQIQDMKCLYCGETFFRQWRDKIINKRITCPFCEEIHINTSNNSFDLRKFDPNKDFIVENNKQDSTTKKTKKPI